MEYQNEKREKSDHILIFLHEFSMNTITTGNKRNWKKEIWEGYRKKVAFSRSIFKQYYGCSNSTEGVKATNLMFKVSNLMPKDKSHIQNCDITRHAVYIYSKSLFTNLLFKLCAPQILPIMYYLSIKQDFTLRKRAKRTLFSSYHYKWQDC